MMSKVLILMIMLGTSVVQAEVVRYLTGDAQDVNPSLHGPAFHLQGGGTDVDRAFQWLFDEVRGCSDCSTKLDVVVLRARGEDGYNEYLYNMKGVDSVETLVITSPMDSMREEIAATIRKAEVIFFSGGDQCNYIRNFRGSAVEAAVEDVYARGGGIGGTSAGVAIMGEFIYDACTGSTKSIDGLANPYHESITFTDDLFLWKNLEDLLTDQHLVERDRIGRTMVFMARQIRDGRAPAVWGLAIERETTVALDRNGIGTVMGKGPVYLILADHVPEVCEPDQPLTYSNFKFWKFESGKTLDLKNRPQTGYYLRSIKNGVVDKDPYNP